MLEVISDMGPLLPWKLHYFGLENLSSYQGNQSSKKKKKSVFITEVEIQQVLIGFKSMAHKKNKVMKAETAVTVSYL